MRALGWVLLLLAGAAAGLAVAASAGRAEAVGSPDGWSRTETRVGFRRPALLGPIGAGWDGWALDHFQALVAWQPSDTLTIEAMVPPLGRLVVIPAVRPDRDAPRGPGLVVTATGIAGVELHRYGEVALPCEGALDPPVDGRVTLTVRRTVEGFEATSGGGVLRCRAMGAQGPPAVQAGLQRVRILRLDDHGPPLPPALLVLGAIGGALVSAGLALGERRLGLDGRVVVATRLPLLLGLPLLHVDGVVLQEALRLPAVPDAGLPALASLGPALGASLLVHAARMARGGRGRALWAAGGLGAVAVLASLVGGAGPAPIVAFGIVGAALGVLLWANVNVVRGVNLLSLGLVVVGAVALELGVRGTTAGLTWSPGGGGRQGVAGQEARTMSEFEALEAGVHTTYPIEGYPVAYGPRRAPWRIVAFGGSSTGGAFQNDDLSEFWPARLQELLGDGVEVVNQGVGAWTTFHIRHYAQRHLEALDADVILVYTGHNEITPSPVPHRELYARWKSGGTVGALTRTLGSVRLFQGLRHALRAGRGQGAAIAVPVDHFRENLQALAAQHDGRMLLVSEGIHPDPAVIGAYREVMAEMAVSDPDVAWLDGSAVLDAQGPSMFLDDCHLSDPGHRVLAGAVARRLAELRWDRPQ